MSDEALVLQILELRGEGYLEVRRSLIKKKQEEKNSDEDAKKKATSGTDGKDAADGKSDNTDGSGNSENNENGKTGAEASPKPKKNRAKLTFNAGIFMKYHTMISGIRQKSKKDEKGWCTWLNVKEMEKMTRGAWSWERAPKALKTKMP